MQVGVELERNVFEKASPGAAGAKGQANGEVGALVVISGLCQKALHQPVETGSGGAKGGVEVVGNAVADLGSDYRWKHGGW